MIQHIPPDVNACMQGKKKAKGKKNKKDKTKKDKKDKKKPKEETAEAKAKREEQAKEKAEKEEKKKQEAAAKELTRKRIGEATKADPNLRGGVLVVRSVPVSNCPYGNTVPVKGSQIKQRMVFTECPKSLFLIVQKRALGHYYFDTLPYS